MTTKEMIEVLQAYDRGEEIQQRTYQLSDNWEREWEDKYSTTWDFNTYNYRVKPKEEKRKFKVGDKVTAKEFANTGISEVWCISIIGKITNERYEMKPLTKSDTDRYIDFEDEDEYIKVDDCLWYWEWWDDYDKCYKTCKERYTKKELLSNFSSEIEVDFTPLYALGFKLPKGLE